MFKKLNIPILGIVQNMSTMKCSKCTHENHIFGDSVHKLTEQEGILLFNHRQFCSMIILGIIYRDRYTIFYTFGSDYNQWL